jgi:hypothetical protein
VILARFGRRPRGSFFLGRIDPLIGLYHGQTAGRLFLGGSTPVVPPVDLTVFSI